MFVRLTMAVCLISVLGASASAQFDSWPKSGSMFVLTTPDGANIPGDVSVKDFPLLVRLHKDFFDFGQANPDGSDLRFATADGVPLAYQIENWDAARGQADLWVRIPQIHGNSSQEIRLFWGKADAKSESSGPAVFGESNGYVSVWHMGDAIADEVGTLESRDVGTSLTPGMIGNARHLAGRQGVFCGEQIRNYPSGGASHSTQAWFRAERPNTTIIGWGNEGGGRGSKVRMQFRSPPHVHIDSDFSDVDAPGRLPMGEWISVVHTYVNGDGRIYINGQLAGAEKPTLNIKNPSRLWLGGWYNNYDFVGDLDEVRVSKVARSAEWVKLEYENQKPMQTLVGPIVPSGNSFGVSLEKVIVSEGKKVTLKGTAGGARKVYWTVTRDGKESVVATDRFEFTFDAGRVIGDQTASIRWTGIFATGAKSVESRVTIKDEIEEPVFTLQAPPTWDGRTPIEVIPQITNRAAMQSQGAAELKFAWHVDGIAAIKETKPDRLQLNRAMNSGTLKVTLSLSNGGAATSQMTTIAVQEPESDPWVQREPAADEKPEDNQFYARDDKNEGTLHHRGAFSEPADTVYLKLYADDRLVDTKTTRPNADKTYSLSTKLKPGLIKYRVEFGTKTGDRETAVHSAKNIVCGDAYLIDGQSNAEATDVGKDDPAFTSEWIRSFGSTAGHPEGARLRLWTNAVCRDRNGGKGQIGYWGLELGRRLVESQQIPICIINGAVGGTRVDQHQRDAANPEDVSTIYGRLLWRVRQARLTHGIRGILWHQGENDQGADGPTGGFGWETYREYFVEMAAGWRQDYPNLQHMYLFQIWPKSCSMGIDGSDNQLREVQRSLPVYFSRMSVMSTLGIKPPGGCHFPPEGYAQFARLITPLVERDNYAKSFSESITPPNLIQSAYSGTARDTIVLEFDQPVVWTEKLANQFYLNGQSGKVSAGSVDGRRITLRLLEPSNATKITYLDSKSWSQDNLLLGTNGIAALTFCNVPIVE